MKSWKRMLALLLVLTMCFSLLPLSAFAEGAEDEEEQIEELLEPEDLEAPEEGDDGDGDDDPCEHEPAEAVTENEVPPSCTEPGSHDEVVYCALCGAELSRETVEDPAPGHTPVDVEEVPAEAGKPGHTAGVKCAVCGAILEGCELIEALPEEEEADPEEGGQPAEGTDILTADSFGEITADADTVGFGSCGTNLTWTLESDGTLTVSGTGEMFDYYSYRDYVEYDRPWDPYVDSIQSVVINPGVSSIGAYAFRRCGSLTSVTIPFGVRLGYCAFAGCTGLTEISIASGTGGIGQSAFGGCTSLQSVVIPEGITGLGKDAFGFCTSLTSVVIPSTCSGIGNSFTDCTGLKTAGPLGSGCNIEFGWEEEIPEGAFYASSTSSNHYIESIVLPENLQRIGKNAFRLCTKLTEMTIPASVSSIGSGAFYKCSGLAGISIPIGVTDIEKETFAECRSLESVELPAGLATIGDSAFYKCESLTDIEIPDSLTGIGEYAFSGCKGLTSVKLPAKVTSIGQRAFSSCTGLKNVILRNGVTSIGEYAFSGCSSLKSCVLPLMLGRIEEGLFCGCANLEWVFIPDYVTGIEKLAFDACSALTDVYYEGSEDDWEELRGKTGSGNDRLTSADVTIHYNCERPEPEEDEREPDELDLWLSDDSTIYDNDLALFCAKLSLAVYNDSNDHESDIEVRRLLYPYGFSGADFSSDNYGGGSLVYTVATRKYAGEDADEIMVIAARGTVTPHERHMDITSAANWDSSVGYAIYDIVKDFRNAIFEGIENQRKPGIRYKYLVTGHSLGGAAANLVGAILTNAYGKSNVYCYTMGALDPLGPITEYGPIVDTGRYGRKQYERTKKTYKKLFTDGYENIHNVYNNLDTFAQDQYGRYLLTGMGRKYGKFGELNLFSKEYRDEEDIPTYFEPVLEDVHYIEIDIIGHIYQMAAYTNHSIYNYINAIENGLVEASRSKWKRNYSIVKCPVDVSVYRGDTLVGQVVDNSVEYVSDGVEIEVISNVKYIYYPDDAQYTVRMEAFDEGTMFFQSYNAASGEAIVFPEVQLVDDKRLAADVGGELQAADVRLLVVDEEDEPLREVLEDGSEILYLEDLSAWPESISMDREYLALKPGDTEQKLTLAGLPAEWAAFVAWSSDNPDVVDVVRTDEGKGLLVPGDVGTAFITASVDTGAGVLSARCRVDVVETGPDPATGEEHFAPDELTDVRLLDTKATVELYSADYTRINVIPVLEQNQQYAQAFTDVLTPDGSADDNNGAAVESAVFVENKTNTGINDLFKLRVVDDHTLEIVPKEKALNDPKAVKGSYKAALLVTADGREFTTAPLALTVKKTQPKVTVKVDKLNSFIPGDTKPIVFSGAAAASAVPDPEKEALQPGWLTYDEKAFTVTLRKEALDLNRSGKLYLLVQPEGWNVKLPVAVSVSAAKTAPKLTLKPNTLSLHPGVNDYAHAAVTVTPAGFNDPEVWTLAVVSVLEGKNDASGALELSVIGNEITARKGAEPPEDDKAHTYKATLALMRKDGDGGFAETSVRTTLTVKLLAASTSITLTAKASGTIDLAVPGSPVTIVPTLKNFSGAANYKITKIYDASGAVVPDGVFKTAGLQITASDAEPGKYSARLTAELGGETLTVDVPFTVKRSAKAPTPSVTLKAAGFIDVIRPGSSITLTPTVKNCYTYDPELTDLQIEKQDGRNWVSVMENSPFNAALQNGVFVLTLKQDSGVDHTKDKFRVRLSKTVAAVGSPAQLDSPWVNLTVKMGVAKIAQSVKAVTMLADDRYDWATVKLTVTDPTLSAIDCVELVPLLDRNKREVFALTDLGGGEYALVYNESLLPAGFTGGTAKLNVFLKGNNSTKPNATLSVGVRLG